MPSREHLHIIQMLNATQGWAAGLEGSLYKSNDGGNSWRRVKVDSVAGGYVRSLSFLSPSLGWVAYGKTPSDVLDYQGSESFLMHTADGGQTWEGQYSGSALEISDVRFVNDQEGWAVGGKRSKETIQRSTALVLHTTDGGKHWQDVSDRLNHSYADSDHVINIYASEPSRSTLLTIKGKIVHTDDGGQKWLVVGTLKDQRQQTVISKIGRLGADRLWLVGGAYSIEGIWGLLARMESDGSWLQYRTDGVFFRDAIFLSDNEVLACGSVPPPGGNFPTHGEREGAIFYSTDGGEDWAIAYRNSQVRSIDALSAIDSNHIWAVGDAGLILRLQSPLDEKPRN